MPLRGTKRGCSDILVQAVDRAKEVLADESLSKTLGESILRLNICGPDLEHVTFVDVPVLASLALDSEKGQPKSAPQVIRKARQYLQGNNSIFLFVISRTSESKSQAILDLIKAYDSTAERTMAIVAINESTGTDSPCIDQLLYLFNEEDSLLANKWHIVNCPSTSENNIDQNQDGHPTMLSSQGLSLFSQIPGHAQGLDALMSRLSDLFAKRLSFTLPDIITKSKDKLGAKQRELESLLVPLGTVSDRSHYLFGVSRHFESIA